MHRLWGRRRLWQQETDGAAVCYDTLWDAVKSVENASVWQDGLRNTGLNLILEDGDTRGIVMVVRDESLTGCEEVEQGTLYGSCAQAIRQWLQSLGGPEGVGLLMYHWLPNGTFASVSGVEQEWGTLLEVAGKDGFHGLVVDGVNDSVRVPDGVGVVSGRLGGYGEATIIEKKQICGDEEGSGVFVLDRQLYPEDLPAVNVTSLGPLESYCWESIVRLAVSSESDFPGLPLTTFAYPVVKPLLDPRANVTLFVPDFANGAIDSSLYVGGSSDPDLFRGEITIFLLSHFLRGHHCPEDLDGNQIQTLAGEYYGEDFKLAFERDKNDENLVYVSMLFGSNQMKRYSAQYLGEACFSSVYSLNSLLTPWNTAQDGNDIPRLPFEYIDDIPLVPSQLDLFNVTNTCGQQTASEIGAIIGSRDEMQQSSSTSTLDGGEIAGIVVGSIAGLCIIVALCLIVWKRKKAKKIPSGKENLAPKYTDSAQYIPHHDDSLSGFKRSNSSAMTSQWTSSGMLELPWDDVILSEDEIIFDEDPLTHEKIVLGRGKFGTVYQGLLMGAEKVAVKCILDSNIELLQKNPESLGRPDSLGPVPREEVLKEISLLKACHSQYVVSFLGATFLPGEVRLITELMPAGDLWSALGRKDGTRRVTWYHGGIYIAMDVAAGLNYLHGRRVIHLDLKSSNILLRESRRSESSYETHTAKGYDVVYRAKISDVGLSRMVPMSHEYIAALEATGTWNWCAPEVILCSKCTAAADIFSYGIVLWEICTGEIPVRGCMRPVRVPEECPQEVADLIDACVNCDNGRQPSDRPTAAEAFDILQKLLQNNSK